MIERSIIEKLDYLQFKIQINLYFSYIFFIIVIYTMKFSYKNVMKMLKDPKNCAIVTVVVLVLVIGGLYMFRKSREGFQADPCEGCDADVLSNDKAVECSVNGCFDESSENGNGNGNENGNDFGNENGNEGMEETTTSMTTTSTTTTSNDMDMGDSPM